MGNILGVRHMSVFKHHDTINLDLIPDSLELGIDKLEQDHNCNPIKRDAFKHSRGYYWDRRDQFVLEHDYYWCAWYNLKTAHDLNALNKWGEFFNNRVEKLIGPGHVSDKHLHDMFDRDLTQHVVDNYHQSTQWKQHDKVHQECWALYSKTLENIYKRRYNPEFQLGAIGKRLKKLDTL